MPKILITTSSFDVGTSKPLTTLVQNGFEIASNPYGRRLTEDEVADLLKEDVVGMIAGVEPLTRGVLQGAKGLKVISRAGTGLDSVDQAAARELQIEVHNTPGAPVPAVAELTVALILDVLRRVSQADRQIREGKWKPVMGKLLAAQTVGIIGYGRVGKYVGRLVRAFGSSVLAYDKQGVVGGDGVGSCALDELLAQSDVVTLHVPHDVSTHHILNKDRLARMKPGAVLVNASRGGLIDETALFVAIQSGHLAGVGLDTFEDEPYKGPLVSLPQVVMTAHMGSYAKEARIMMEQEAAENLVKGLISCGVVTSTMIDGR